MSYQTRKQTKRSTIFYLALMVVGLLILADAYNMRTTIAAALPKFEPDPVRQAWQMAKEIGRYDYRADAQQTNHPLPSLENAGRSPKTRRMTVNGTIDLPNESMEMQIWSQGDNSTIELRVADGKAYGRVNPNDPWEEVEETTDFFAPGGDPLGFLVAAENIQEAVDMPDAESDGITQRILAPDPTGHTRYTFDINGPTYAHYMRGLMEDELRRTGELPPGVHLGLVDQYVEMKAHGELWINEQGLPTRQIIHMEFPPEQGARSWIESEITSDFSNWSQESSTEITPLWQNPQEFLHNPSAAVGLSDADVQQLGYLLGFGLLMVALALFVWTHRRSRRIQATLALAIIASLLMTPLLQTERVYAFSVSQESKRAEYLAEREAQKKADDLSTELAGSNFNPTVNPLERATESNLERVAMERERPIAAASSGPSAASMSAPTLQATCFVTVTSDDCDGDGLENGIEIFELGTDPENIDSDGDEISDKTEVEGFFLSPQHWYLDPLNPDSNRDGQIDSIECPELRDVENGSLTTASGTSCANSDADGTPDVFDFDNDGDGVPDSVDSSPYYIGTLSSTARDHFTLNLSGFDTNKPILVDIEVRPTDPKDLWQTNNIYDWPRRDNKGQIFRKFNNTFFDVSTIADPGPRLDDGDVMLTPMLEIVIPDPADANNTNPSGGLPILDTIDSASYDFANNHIDEWLDTSALATYGISARQAMTEPGPIFVYVPLTVIKDPVGDMPVAWGGQMFYRPENGWYYHHEVNLIWMVTALIDTCQEKPDDVDTDYDVWCANKDNWTSEKNIIQVYYEYFTVTGLTVTEEHGTKTAAIAQANAASLSYADRLWHLASKLQQTFSAGNLVSGVRFDIDELERRFGDGSTIADGDPELWGITKGELLMGTNSAPDQATAMDALINTQIPTLLGRTTYGTTTNRPVTVLFAREEAKRMAGLGSPGAMVSDGRFLSFDLSLEPETTYTSLHWGPFEYDGTKWLSEDLVTYLQLLESRWNNVNSVFTTDVLKTLIDDEEVENEDLARLGAINLAKNFYLTFNRGLTTVVEAKAPSSSNRLFVGEETIVDADLTLPTQEVVVDIVQDILGLFSAVIEAATSIEMVLDDVADETETNPSTYLDQLSKKASILDALGSIEAELDDSLGIQVALIDAKFINRLAQRELPGLLGVGDATLKVGNRYVDVDAGDKAWDVGAALAIAGATIEILGAELGWDEDATFIAATTLQSYGAAVDVVGAFRAQEVFRSIRALEGFGQAEFDAMLTNTAKAVKNGARVCAIIGFVVTVAISVVLLIYTIEKEGIEWGSLQANLLMANTIGTIVVAYILLVIVVAFPIVGAIIVAVIALIDLIISGVCMAVRIYSEPTEDRNGDGLINEDDAIDEGVEEWVCGGITGAMANAISYAIYDQYVTVDFDDEDRIDVVFEPPTVEDDGFIVGSRVSANLTLTNTLSLNEPDRLIVRTSYLNPGTTNLDRDRLRRIMRRSNFAYSLQDGSIGNRHENLSLLPTGTYTTDDRSFPLSWATSFDEPGVNKRVGPYLTEAYAVAVIECWGFIGADESATCKEKSIKGTNNTSLYNEFVFDILPANVSGFADFSDLRAADRDGDGLRGSLDPDDGNADTDDDGLSDFWERENGTNPRNADMDGDGLTDYWEIHYGTNLHLADVDGDGLTDEEEFYHSGAVNALVALDHSTWRGGWLYTYDFNDNDQPRQILVSADPYLADTDFDTLRDQSEFIYGDNPTISSELNGLSLETKIQTASRVPGYAALDETIGYTATIQNELRNRVLNGLLEAEYPVDKFDDQIVFRSLYPQRATDINGNITVTETGTTSITLRAGVVVDTSNVDEVFVLQFNEDSGSSTFLDATVAQHDFSCPPGSSSCPTSTGSTATFDGQNWIALEHHDAFNQDAFTLSIWFMPEDDSGNLYIDTEDFAVEVDNNNHVNVSLDKSQKINGVQPLKIDKWNHVLVVYDGVSVALYVNGVLDGDANVNAITRDDLDIVIGDSMQATFDEVILYDYAFTDGQIEELFGALVYHYTFDDDTVTLHEYQPGIGNRVCDSYIEEKAGQLEFDCSVNDIGHGIYAGPKHVVDGGITGSAVKLFKKVDPDLLIEQDPFMNAKPEDTFTKADKAFSFALWLKPYQWLEGGSRHLFTMESSNNIDTFKVRMVNNVHLRVHLGSCTGDQSIKIDDFAESDYKWEHLVITYDVLGTVALYHNGQQVLTRSDCGIVDFQNIDEMYFGSKHEPGTEDNTVAFYGILDEFRLYRKALSPAEVEKSYGETGRRLELDFDEPPGQTLFVSQSAYEHNGRCAGDTCPDSGIPGRANQAVRFDGNDFIEVAAADELGLTNSSFTVMAWVKGTGSIFGTEDEEYRKGLHLFVLGNGTPNFGFFGVNTVGTTSIDKTQWNHLAFRYTYDESTQLGEQAIFINGVEDVAETGKLSLEATGMTFVGHSLAEYFTGLIDHIVIASNALTEDQIQDVMNEAPLFNLHLDEDLNTTTFHNEGQVGSDAICAGDACPTTGAKGWMREAPVFDGNDKLTIPSLANFGDAVSIGLWVKPTKTIGNVQFLLGDGAGQSEFLLQLEPDSTTVSLSVLEFIGSGNSAICFQSGLDVKGNLLEDRWNHVMVTFEPTDSGTRVVLYIDGVKRDQHTYGSLCSIGLTAIGDNFVGQLDEISIYNTFLTADEVEDVYDYQAAWYDVTIQHQITVDGDDPMLTIDFPTHVANKETMLEFSAVDATSTVQQVEIKVTPPTGAASTGFATSSNGTGNGAWLYNFAPTDPGSYTLDVKATDVVGREMTESHSVLVDDTKPSATLDSSLTAAPLIPHNSGQESLFGTISDPGAETSGVAMDTVSIEIVDWEAVNRDAFQAATSDGSSWQIDYPFLLRPYGSYDVWVSAEDMVGNTYTDTVGTIEFDGLGPDADVSVGGNLITTTNTVLSGSVSDVPMPPQSKLMHLHFEEASGATSFVDSSSYQFVATCNNPACPTAGVNGYHGNAAQFDGNDSLTIAAQEALTLTKGTMMAWVQPTWGAGANGYNPALLAIDDGLQTGFRWQIQDDYQALLVDNGSEVLSVPVNLTASQWSHLALTIDDDTWTAFVDGVATDTITQTVSIATDLPFNIGSATGSSGFFSGQLDEVVVYNNPLDDDEIYDIANPLATSVTQLEMKVRHFNGAVWPDVAPDELKLYLPLDDEADTAEFSHNSHIAYTVDCAAAADECPTAGGNGVFGTRLPWMATIISKYRMNQTSTSRR